MKIVNIRVYKIELPDGSTAFETKNREGRGSAGALSLQQLAFVIHGNVWAERNEAKKASELAHVTIDTYPFHEIECPSDLQPRRCFPLTKAERIDFWRYFNKCVADESL